MMDGVAVSVARQACEGLTTTWNIWFRTLPAFSFGWQCDQCICILRASFLVFAGFGWQFQFQFGMAGGSRRPEHDQTSHCDPLCWHLVAQGREFQVHSLKAILRFHPGCLHLWASSFAPPWWCSSTRNRRIHHVFLPRGQLPGQHNQAPSEMLGSKQDGCNCPRGEFAFSQM